MSLPASRTEAAFTLLEIMIVLLIIGILSAVLLITGGKLFQQSKGHETSIRLQQLTVLIEEFRTIEGRYPGDALPAQGVANKINSNSEALFLALFHPDYTGTRPDQNWLGNGDEDATTRNLTLLPGRELFEIEDSWGNPILYFESLHYGSSVSVRTVADGEVWTEDVSARRNPVTGGWERPNSFQLLSAGEDGRFLTEDDLGNFASP